MQKQPYILHFITNYNFVPETVSKICGPGHSQVDLHVEIGSSSQKCNYICSFASRDDIVLMTWALKYTIIICFIFTNDFRIWDKYLQLCFLRSYVWRSHWSSPAALCLYAPHCLRDNSAPLPPSQSWQTQNSCIFNNMSVWESL